MSYDPQAAMEDFKRAYNSTLVTKDKFAEQPRHNEGRTGYGMCDECGFIVNLVNHDVRCRIPTNNLKFQYDASWIGDAYLTAHVKFHILISFGRDAKMVEQMVSNASLSNIYRLLRPQDYHEAFSASGSSPASMGRAVEAAYALLPQFRISLLDCYKIDPQCAFDYSLSHAVEQYVSKHVALLPVTPSMWGYCYLTLFPTVMHGSVARECGVFPYGHLLTRMLLNVLDDNFVCYVRDYHQYTHVSSQYFEGAVSITSRRAVFDGRESRRFGFMPDSRIVLRQPTQYNFNLLELDSVVVNELWPRRDLFASVLKSLFFAVQRVTELTRIQRDVPLYNVVCTRDIFDKVLQLRYPPRVCYSARYLDELYTVINSCYLYLKVFLFKTDTAYSGLSCFHDEITIEQTQS